MINWQKEILKMDSYPKNIVSFVARSSKTGKTTLLERVIKELKQKGMNITAIKHSLHGAQIQIDKEGKDSWRFVQSGADRVMLFSDRSMYMYENKKPEPAYLISIASRNADLVIIEGFKDGPFKKIELFRKELNNVPLCVEKPEGNFIAIITDDRVDVHIPCFSFRDIKGINNFLIRNIL